MRVRLIKAVSAGRCICGQCYDSGADLRYDDYDRLVLAACCGPPIDDYTYRDFIIDTLGFEP